MKAVNYQIEMLSVGAADAFIIYFIDETTKEHLVLVDAGNYEDGQTIIDHIRKYYTNPVIDLAIVTHPDDDHYGGFIKILEKIRDKERDAIKINKFWVNDPGNNHVDKNEVKWINKQRSVNVKVRSVYDFKHGNLIDLIDSLSISREEKFAQVYKNPFSDYLFVPSDYNFPCFKIIGPTKAYFENLVPNFRNDGLNFFEKEGDDNYYPSKDIPNGKCLSPALDAAVDDTSAHNQSSIVFLFEPENGNKYLFMGDAGRDAFDKIDTLAKDCVKDATWLKVPHHGSKHNMDSAMINWIKPKTAFISTERIGNYLNQCTVNALKNSGCSVYSTHKEKTHFIHNQIGDREGYSTATPL
jgi:beta-lactamase superfamily II metal-dependent hydrolase